MSKLNWSSEEERVLVEMVEAGCTVPEIREALPDRSRDSIVRKARSMDIKAPSSSGYGRPDLVAYKKYMELRKG